MKIIKQTIKLIRKHPVFLILSFVFDFLFFFFLGFFIGLIKNRLNELVTILASSIPTAIESIDVVSISGLLSSADIKPFISKLLIFIVVFYILIFFVFVVFQGLAWWVANIIVKQKSFRKFFIPFFKCSLIWGIILCLLHFANLIVDLRFIIVKVMRPEAFNLLGSIFDVLFVIAAVLAFFSLASLKVFGFFKIKLKKSLIIILFLFVVFALAQGVPWLIAKLSPLIALIFSFLLYLSGFLFLRVYAIKTLK